MLVLDLGLKDKFLVLGLERQVLGLEAKPWNWLKCKSVTARIRFDADVLGL